MIFEGTKVMNLNWLERLSTQLSLFPHSQDWGICNADANRLEEFLDFYGSHIPEDPYELELLAELILQSAEDAMVAGKIEIPLRLRLIKFIADHGQDFPDTLEYWSELEEDDWFLPVLIHEAQSAEISRRFN
jgi:hypothetical protein